ncbi:MAG: hypothetical protein IKL04_07180 [Lachnospiraceae bacterium]|nr:hypothetical protein [Lachnospiraceae bacterium]
MKYQNYKISYGSMEQLYSIVSTAVYDWNDQLSLLESAYTELIELESFQATAAQSAKAYLKEVHGTLVLAIQQMINNYQAELLLYKTGFYGIDSNIYACIPEEAVLKVKNTLSSEAVALSTIGQNVESSIDSVSDIFWVGKPTKYALQGVINTFNTDIEEYRLSIDDYEMRKISSYTTTVRAALDALQATVKDYLNNGTNIASYQAGSITGNTYMLDLYTKVQGCTDQVAAKTDAIERAVQKQGEVYEQIQKDYEAACEARKDKGTSNMIMGGLAVVAGTAAIVFTAGMATPIVATAVVTGSCTIAYGASNMAEGAQDFYYGCIGDLESGAWNPIRDTVFAGNQKLYDTWGSLNMTVAMVCVPAGQAANAAAGSSTSVVVKSALKKAGTELAKDQVFDFASGHVVDYLAQNVNLSQTQRTLLNIGISIGLEKGADALGNSITGSNGKLPTDKMTYEDAKAYNIENGLVDSVGNEIPLSKIDFAEKYSSDLEKSLVELAAEKKVVEMTLKHNGDASVATGPKIEDPGIAKDGAKIEGTGDVATTVTGPKVENPGVAKDGVQIENAGDAATTATSGPKIEDPGIAKDGAKIDGSDNVEGANTGNKYSVFGEMTEADGTKYSNWMKVREGEVYTNYVQAGKELSIKLEVDGYKILKTEDATIANADWYDMGFDKPPIAEKTMAYTVEAGNHSYSRVFLEGYNNPMSTFIIRTDDIAGLNAQEIAEKLALPRVPNRVVEVELPPSTPLEVSITGPQPDWGTIGGDVQFAIKDVDLNPQWFTNIKNLE